MKIRPTLAILAAAAGLSTTTLAKDHILTVGGGYSPSGNQVSLERNVVFFRKLLAEQLPPDLVHDLYFSDGDSPNPDLQFEPEDASIPKANLMAASLLGSTRNIKLHYRNNELQDVRGPSSPEALEAWFKDTGSKLCSGDRLILYITAHGGSGPSKGNRQNTKLFMWNNQSIDAAKLAGLIDGLPEGVSVVTVMVQCYSGGFANLIFEEANSEKADVQRDVCGFYATVHDRVAAGCTADINEEDYDEYSSHFWAALRGKTRVEHEIARPDYDGDRNTSFEEAHAFTLVTSQSLDIPIKTSGAFLRKHSKVSDDKNPELLHPEKTSYFKLLTHARPADLAVLDHLSNRLSLTSAERGEEAKKKAEEIQEKRKELEGKSKEKKKVIDTHRKEIARDLKNRWPQLNNMFSPDAIAVIRDQGDEFVKAVERHPKFPEWVKTNKERNKFVEERFELEKQWAHHKRFLRVLENVALAANLEKVADPEEVARYAKLIASESSTLVTAPTPTPEPAEEEAAPEEPEPPKVAKEA